MKKLQVTVLFLALAGGLAFSQEEPPARFQEAMEKMKAERVSFISGKLQLTVEEAEKFWPVYNEYLAKREKIMWGKRQRMPRNHEQAEVTDAEMENRLAEILDQEVQQAELKKEYFNRLKQVLPIRKVILLHRVEQEFMNHMINQFRESRGPGRSGAARGGF